MSAVWPSQEALEELARAKCGCRQCSNPNKHPCGQVLSVAIPVARALLEKAVAKGREDAIAHVKPEVHWIQQTVHRSHHDGPLDECKINTCDAALKLIGKR